MGESGVPHQWAIPMFLREYFLPYYNVYNVYKTIYCISIAVHNMCIICYLLYTIIHLNNNLVNKPWTPRPGTEAQTRPEHKQVLIGSIHVRPTEMAIWRGPAPKSHLGWGKMVDSSLKL